mgnify:CR=1 FL=1
MKPVLNLYKKVGQTPLEAIKLIREKYPHYKRMKMGYAGRLDPLAEGILIILLGDENKKIGEYMGFDKEYRAEILLGFSSDSHDVLGIAEKGKSIELDIKDLKKKIKNFRGKYEQKIPKYSSYKIDGKPMFYYARKGIDVQEIKKNVYIKKIEINSIYKISSKKLLKFIINKINNVNGDFRQSEILDNWNNILREDEYYLVVDLNVECSSGTYIRAIAQDLGSKINCGALLLSLKRIRVGKFLIRDSMRLS